MRYKCPQMTDDKQTTIRHHWNLMTALTSNDLITQSSLQCAYDIKIKQSYFHFRKFFTGNKLSLYFYFIKYLLLIIRSDFLKNKLIIGNELPLFLHRIERSLIRIDTNQNCRKLIHNYFLVYLICSKILFFSF